MITNIIQFLQGKKVYILMAVAVVYALSGYFTGHFDAQTTIQMVWVALSGSAARAAIAK